MKRNNVAKSFGIASLCLATAISAFSGLASSNNNVVLADEATTIQLSDFVYTTANVTKEARTTYKGKDAVAITDAPCLRVSSDKEYSATFRKVFTGDTTLRFAFPERKPDTATSNNWGDFRFTIADVTDDNNYFDIVYEATANGTTMYIQWNGNTVQAWAGTTTSAGALSSNYYYNDALQTVASANVSPSLMGYSKTYGTREGKLTLSWADDVLSIISNSPQKQDASDAISAVIAKFDGTYDATAEKNGFVNKTAWGLPKLSFPNGYTVSFSSSYENENTTDKATDVSFSQLTNNGTTYSFAEDTLAKDNTMTEFEDKFVELTANDVPTLATGKVFLGWKNSKSGKLYPTNSLMPKNGYEALVIDFDTVNGASVRIAGRSGIRFQTLFNATEYAAIKEAGYLQSFGTLVAYTDTLTTAGKDFTIENYQGVDSFAQVKNTKGVFDYTNDSKAYKAYTMAIVDIADYTKAYSARGYLVVAYANGTTQTVYTDYNVTDNSRSIAVVANLIKTADVAEYNAMTDAQKAIIDAYAAAYVA